MRAVRPDGRTDLANLVNPAGTRLRSRGLAIFDMRTGMAAANRLDTCGIAKVVGTHQSKSHEGKAFWRRME